MDKYHPYEVVGEEQDVQGFGIPFKKEVADASAKAQLEVRERQAEWNQRAQGDRQIVLDASKTGDPADALKAATLDPSKTLTVKAGEKSVFTKAVDYAKAHPVRTAFGLAVIGGMLYLATRDEKPTRSLSGIPRKRKKSSPKATHNTGRKKRTPAPQSRKKVRSVHF